MIDNIEQQTVGKEQQIDIGIGEEVIFQQSAERCGEDEKQRPEQDDSFPAVSKLPFHRRVTEDSGRRDKKIRKPNDEISLHSLPPV